MQEHALRLTNITKRFGDFTAVDDVSLGIPRGSIYGFLGPNGAGKTTAIRMIVDIIRPTSGQVEVLGHASALEVRERIGYLPEEKGLYKKMTAAATVSYFATLKGVDRREAKRRAYALLEKYGLKDFADAKIQDLSKGMSQKVQVLSAIVHAPELIILDEPFSGLDPVNQQVLEALIQDMADAGNTVIFSTHVMQHAERLCDRLLLIAKGRKIFDGTVEEARGKIPRRVLVETSDDVATLGSLDGVVAVVPVDAQGKQVAEISSGHTRWEIRIQEQADPQTILQRCFETGIGLRRFDYTEPSLHDVFVALVGTDLQHEEH